MSAEGQADPPALVKVLEAEVIDRYGATFGGTPTQVHASADLRYRGQSHELEVPARSGWAQLRADFERAHLQRFGFVRSSEPIELVNLRCAATGAAPLTWTDLPGMDRDRTPAGGDGIWQRESLPPGFTLEGPAVVVETDSAVLLEAGDGLTVLEDGALEIML